MSGGSLYAARWTDTIGRWFGSGAGVRRVGRVRQIVSNFLSNAIKFTESGRVDVALEGQGAEPEAGPLGGDRLVFRVTDTGIGVSEVQQKRLFQPFSQADSDTTRRFGGTGLGLTISGTLVGLMGGRIWVESEPNNGSTFHFTHPCASTGPGAASWPPNTSGICSTGASDQWP